MMLLVVPAWVLFGVPLNRPVLVLSESHDGLFDDVENVNVLPSGSLAVGVNE
jgi:hypothetical protein